MSYYKGIFYVISFLFFTFFEISFNFATEINVEAGDYAITNAFKNASAGDILLLVSNGGVYRDTMLTIDKNIIIKSAPDLVNRPTWEFLGEAGATNKALIKLSADLVLKDLIITMKGDPDGVIIKNNATLPNKIVIDGCELKDGNTALTNIETVPGEIGTIDTLVITNSIFHGFTTACLRPRGIKNSDPTIGRPGVRSLVRIENCTFYSCFPDGEAIIVFGYGIPEGSDSLKVLINHVTIDSVDNGIQLHAVSSSSVVKNSIISHTVRRPGIGNDVRAPYLFDYCNIWENGQGFNAGVLQGDSLWYVDPMFNDPGNGDFTLSQSSPLLNKADDGFALGDLRWDPNYTKILDKVKVNLPSRFILEQNYPNPFNPTTVIAFQLSEASEIELSVHNIAGAKVATLAKGKFTQGRHEIEFDATGLASGIYIYLLKARGEIQYRKMVLLK